MSIIQQALQAYLELAQHMHDEVCQSYQGDVMLAKQAMAALSQEAEPVAWIDLSKMTPSGMVYATGFKASDRQTALYASPPKPAPLPQPVASVPQDVEKFANDVAEWSQTQFEDVIRVSHFREFMRQRDTGHARVPVEPTRKMCLAATSYTHSHDAKLIYKAMIAASQQEGV